MTEEDDEAEAVSDAMSRESGIGEAEEDVDDNVCEELEDEAETQGTEDQEGSGVEAEEEDQDPALSMAVESEDAGATSSDEGVNDTFYLPRKAARTGSVSSVSSSRSSPARGARILRDDATALLGQTTSSATRPVPAVVSGVASTALRSVAESQRLAYRVHSMKTSLFKHHQAPAQESGQPLVQQGQQLLPEAASSDEPKPWVARPFPVHVASPRPSGPVSSLPAIPLPRDGRIAFRATAALLKGQEGLLADAALFLGRSFRPGWGFPDTIAIVRGSVVLLRRACKVGGQAVAISCMLPCLVRLICMPMVELRASRRLPEQPVSGAHWKESFYLLMRQSRLALPRGDGPASTERAEGEEIVELRDPVQDAAATLVGGICSRRDSDSGMAEADESEARALPAHLAPRILISEPLEFATFPALLEGVEAWRLAAGLFDPLILLGSLDGLDEEQIALLHADARKVAVSEWLKRSLRPDIQRQLHAISTTTSKSSGAESADVAARRLLLLLSGRQVKRALQEAQAQGNHHLAILIAQLGGPSVLEEASPKSPQVSCPTDANVMALLGKQLHIWRAIAAATSGKPRVILSPELEAVYLLLAGDSVQWPATFFDLPNWRQILGCLLWYAAGASAGLDEVLEAFEATFSAVPRAIPISPYLRTADAVMAGGGEVESPVPLDIAFHLLRLHLRPHAVSLEQVLELESNTRCPTDYSLSWFFAVVLGSGSSTMALGADEIGSGPAWARPERGDALTRDFAWQLVCAGHWRWALYCAMHVRQAGARALLVQRILAHAVPWLGEDASREAHLAALRIPQGWVEEARALYALDRGDVHGYIVHLLGAGHHSLAHQLLCTLLAPRLILDENWGILEGVLRQVEAGRVDEWERGGQLLLDFLALRRLLDPESVALADLTPNAATALVVQVQRLLHARMPSLPEWGAMQCGDAASGRPLHLPPALTENGTGRAHCKSLAMLNASLTRWLQRLYAACPDLVSASASERLRALAPRPAPCSTLVQLSSRLALLQRGDC